MVRIEVTGNTMADALGSFCANLDDADVETILAELGWRLASEYVPRFIEVVPWAETQYARKVAALNAKKKAKRASKTKRANKTKRARR